GPPVATADLPRSGEDTVRRPTAAARVVGLALRFALNAPPYGLRRASLRARPTTKNKEKEQNQKGDISNEVRKGTFLKRLDIAANILVDNADDLIDALWTRREANPPST